MGDVDHLFVHRVGVLSRRHPHGLSRLPVAGCEGKRGLVECYIGVGDTSDRHCHVPNRLGIQDDGVGVEVSLFYLERCVGDRHPGSVVVGHRDGYAASGHSVVIRVASRGHGVRDVDHVFVDGVVVLSCRHPHGLCRVPAAGREGERGLVEGQVCAGEAAHGHRHVPGRLGIQDDGVGLEVSLLHVNGGLRDRHSGSVVVRHGDRHTAGGQAIVFGVVTRTDGVRDVDHLFVDGVVVLHSRYLHLLRRFPVAGGEGERGLVEG